MRTWQHLYVCMTHFFRLTEDVCSLSPDLSMYTVVLSS